VGKGNGVVLRSAGHGHDGSRHDECQKTEAHRSDPPGASPKRPDRVSVVVRAPHEEQPSCAVNGATIFYIFLSDALRSGEVMRIQMREGERSGR
jgi:hypothetical protein